MSNNGAPHFVRPIVPNQNTRQHRIPNRRRHCQGKTLLLQKRFEGERSRLDRQANPLRHKQNRAVARVRRSHIRHGSVEDLGNVAPGGAGDREGRIVEVVHGAIVGRSARGVVPCNESQVLRAVTLATEEFYVIGFTDVVHQTRGFSVKGVYVAGAVREFGLRVERGDHRSSCRDKIEDFVI